MEARHVLIVSGQHFVTAARKVDLHFIADELIKSGAHVDFITTRLSQASRFIKDGRWQFARCRGVNQWNKVSEKLDEFIWVPVIHPIRVGVAPIDWLSGLVFKWFGEFLPAEVIERGPEYSHIIIESGLPVLLYRRLKRACPNASFIYNGADRLVTVGAHPLMQNVLDATARDYDRIRIAAEGLASEFPPDAKLTYIPHGITKALFDTPSISPYTARINAVCVGDMLFDGEAVRRLAVSVPECEFHLFGKLAVVQDAPTNVIAHGERPFAEIVPFIQHASVGLAPYRHKPGAEYLAQSSLKLSQYAYCGLPVVAPIFARREYAGFCGYEDLAAGVLEQRFAKALSMGRQEGRGGALGWDEVTSKIFCGL